VAWKESDWGLVEASPSINIDCVDYIVVLLSTRHITILTGRSEKQAAIRGESKAPEEGG